MKKLFSKSERLILMCPSCQGLGKQDERTSAYDTERVICKDCDGTGRIIKVVTTEYLPFKN
jgi:DnaJ-class molecular chaperone